MKTMPALAVLACLLSGAAAAQSSSRTPSTLTEPLRTCPDGGFALPGSSTCLRLSGQVTSAMVLRATTDGRVSPAHGLSLRERARLTVDVRTPTELGPLRIYTSIRVGTAPDLPRR